jgi:hypothetical protein
MVFSYLVMILGVILFVLDIRNPKLNKKYLAIWLGSISLLVIINNVYNHYFLASIVFFLLWVLQKRKGLPSQISKLLLTLLLLGSFISLPKVLSEKNWENDINSVVAITDIIEKDISENDLINPNIAVLASPDPNIYGRRFRDLMLVKGKQLLKTKGEYDISDNLYVLTYKSEKDLRSDESYEMSQFRDGVVRGFWEIEGSKWLLYRFDRY